MIKLSRRGLAVAAVATVAAIVIPASPAEAADPRLDQAMDNLIKAKALLQASSAGDVNNRTQRHFARHVDRAIADIDRCMEQIEEAKQAVDGPTP